MNQRTTVSDVARWWRGVRIMIGLALVAVLGGSAGSAWGDQVPLCHRLPNQPNRYGTIMVDQHAVAAHLRQGDVPGACQPDCANDLLCDDNNACTIDRGTWTVINDNQGQCSCTNTPYTCAAPDQCHEAGTCNGDGTCSFANKADGNTCDDGNANTVDDLCTAGVCAGVDHCIGVTCAAQDQCHVAGTCIDHATGACSNPYSPSGTPCGPAPSGDCDAQNTCDGAGACIDRVQPATTPCTGASQGGACDNNAADHCSGTDNTCMDAFQPSSYVCASDTGPNGEYLCRDAVHCNGANGACPLPNGSTIIGSYDATKPCHSSTGPCDPAEYCASYGVCPPDVKLSAGAVCAGAAACEQPYTCDANAKCNPNGFLSGTASCRAPANDCDQRDYCGSCDSSGNCSSPFPSGDVRDRTDFTAYPECGPDIKKPDGTACTNGPFAGTCSAGQCITRSNCHFDIDCPDGYVCNIPNCVQAPVDHGYGDACVGKKVCDLNSPSQKIGTICTFPVDCQDATHPGGNCVSGIFGDCGSDARGPLLCCAGMAGDGIGTAASPGQIGRCQECCQTSFNGALGCGDPFCCDGKCTDVETDPHNCGGCAYNGGLECDNLIDACSPSVLGCEDSQCVMGSPCPILDPICSMSDTITVPDPACSYCAPFLTLDPSLVNTGCYTDSDCASSGVPVVTGSCHRVTGRCTPDSAHPNQECTSNSDCQDSTMQGSCWDYCFGLFNFAAGNTPTINIPVGDCSAPPYTGCTVTCTPPPSGIIGPNVGNQCQDDSDCTGGTTCQMSCNLNYLDNICFSPTTCQW